jgi:hypothetical protein
METFNFIFILFLQFSMVYLLTRRDDEMADTLKKLREWEKSKKIKHVRADTKIHVNIVIYEEPPI